MADPQTPDAPGDKGPDAGRDSGAEAGSDHATGAGADTRSDTGSATGPDTRPDRGGEPAVDPGAEADPRSGPDGPSGAASDGAGEAPGNTVATPPRYRRDTDVLNGENQGDEETPNEPRESLFEAPPMGEQERMVEAILFASSEPVTVADLNARMPHGCDGAAAVEQLRKRYEGRGVRVVRLAEAWAIRTAPDLGFLLQKETIETRKLSRAAIETLAIIAYHQPVTRAEIEEIRGVSVSRGTIDLLLELEWIRFGRRRMTPGRPVTFVVTPLFLDHFGLETPRDLPGLKDLRAAGLLESRPPPGRTDEGDDDDGDEGQDDLFEDDDTYDARISTGGEAGDGAADGSAEAPDETGDKG